MAIAEKIKELIRCHCRNFIFCIYRLLNSSLSNAENPLRAARVYDNIAAAILEAEEAARKAKEDANNAINIVSSYFYMLDNFACS